MTSFAAKKGLPSPENPNLRLTTGEINISKDDVEEVVSLLEGVKKSRGGDGAVISAVLSAAAMYTDPPTLRAKTVQWLERKKNPMTEEDRKFSDGIANAKPANTPEEVVHTHFYDPTYAPPFPPQDLHQDIPTWCTPTGEIWNHSAAADLEHNCDVVLRHHASSQPPSTIIPLWLYSASQLGRHKIYATWVIPADNHTAARWKPIPSSAIERCLQPDGALLLDPSWMNAYNFPAGSIPPTATLGTPTDPYPELLRGNTACIDFRYFSSETKCSIAAHKSFHLARYECLALGDGQWSPLRDVVLWLPRPTEAGLEVPLGELPPPGILEYLYSRGYEEEISWPLEPHGWSAKCLYGETLKLFSMRCFSEPDQQLYNTELHEKFNSLHGVLLGKCSGSDAEDTLEWLHTWCTSTGHTAPSVAQMTEELDGLSGAIGENLLDAKLRGDDKPPPGVLAHALEVQELDWGGRKYLLNLSGMHPCVVVDGKAHEVFRVSDTYDDQIFWHVNYAMRSKQFGTETSLVVKEGPAEGKYLPPPQEEVASEIVKWDDDWDGQDDDDSVAAVRASPVVYTRTTKPACTAQWDGHAWAYTLDSPVGLQPFNIVLTLGTWLIPQITPFVYYLNKALALLSSLDGCKALPGLVVYRGLRGVCLPHTIYDDDKVVLWSAYSSASQDRGVASSFATGDGAAAVFALTGKTCVCISKWSRFGREREWLFPPNTTFQVTSTLSEEQAKILGLDKLQLFTMQEVSMVETLLIYLRSLVNVVAATVEGSTMPKHVEQIFSVMKHLTNGRVTEALRVCLDVDLPILYTRQGAEICGMLLRMGGDDKMFTVVAMGLAEPMPVIFGHLMRAGARFVEALGWMTTYEAAARAVISEMGILFIEEVLERADIREENSLEFSDIHKAYHKETNLIMGRVDVIKVSGLVGCYSHMNGVYAIDPPAVVWCHGLVSYDSLGWVLDASRPWGVFVDVTKELPASSWGLTSGTRLLAMRFSNQVIPFKGLDSVGGVLDEIRSVAESLGSGELPSLLVEKEPVYTLLNPIRFQSYCTLSLDVNGEWRLADVDIRQRESERHAGWDEWLPVGKWQGDYDKTAAPYKWLLGQWAQRTQHLYQWYITGCCKSVTGLNGGAHSSGQVHDGYMTYACDEGAGCMEEYIKTAYDDTQRLEQARRSILECLDTGGCIRNVHVPKIFSTSKALPEGYYAVHKVGPNFVLKNHHSQLTYSLERKKVQGVYPFVAAAPPISTLDDRNTMKAPTFESQRREGVFNVSLEEDDDHIPFEVPSVNPKKWPVTCHTSKPFFAGHSRIETYRTYNTPPQPLPSRYKVVGCLKDGGSVKGWNVEGDASLVETQEGKQVAVVDEQYYEWDWWHVPSVDVHRKCAAACSLPPVDAYLEAQKKSGDTFGELLSDDSIDTKVKQYMFTYEKKDCVRNLFLTQYNCEVKTGSAPELPDVKSLWEVCELDLSQLKDALSAYKQQTAKAEEAHFEAVASKAKQAVQPEQVDTEGRSGGLIGESGLISIHIGQAGVQIGDALWELYSLEHSDDACSSLLFRELSNGALRPRSLFIDSDPSTIDNMRTKHMLDSMNYVRGKCGAKDLYTRGRDTESHDLLPNTSLSLNRLVEECDRVSGIHITHSASGGTGSGFNTKLTELLKNEYPKVPVHNFTVYPSTCYATPTGVYNTLHTLATTLDTGGIVTVFDNRKLHQLCAKRLNLKSAMYYHTNHLIAQVMSSLTASIRHVREQGSLRCDIMDTCTSLVPYPRLRYTCASFVPCLGEHEDERPRVEQIVLEAHDPNMCMIPLKPRRTVITGGLYLKGRMAHCNIITARNVVGMMDGVITTPWSSRISISTTNPRFVKGGGIACVPRTCAYLQNTDAMRDYVCGYAHQFDLLYAKRAFRHWYACDDDEFSAMREDVAAMCKDYEEVADGY